jgi:2',3'-cyclic-nucleotide 2'-phosphodiesterase (5'-nucleotidase family)
MTTNGSAMGQEMKFDSDKKEDMESETGKLMKDQLNVTKEIEISEMAKVIKSATKAAPAAPSGKMMDMINNMTGGYIDESNGASSAFEIIPAGKKIGDFWSDSTIIGDIKTYNSYTLKSINNNIATLELKGKQVINKKMEQQGMEINIKMEAKISGESIVDINTGLLQQKTTLTDGNGSAEVMGQSIPMSSKITTITSIKKI